MHYVRTLGTYSTVTGRCELLTVVSVVPHIAPTRLSLSWRNPRYTDSVVGSIKCHTLCYVMRPIGSVIISVLMWRKLSPPHFNPHLPSSPVAFFAITTGNSSFVMFCFRDRIGLRSHVTLSDAAEGTDGDVLARVASILRVSGTGMGPVGSGLKWSRSGRV